MRIGWPAGELRSATQRKVAGAAAAVTMAAVVYSQFNLYGALGRDSAIYLYGGQRLTHGVPPYASIMDPKGPIPGILCGFGVAVARLFGRNDVLVVRAEFCALSILGVLGVYLLVLELWHSVVAAVVAAAAFTSFKVYGYDALGIAPDGHTPGVVFLTFATWLTVRRQWYWAGFAASLAFFSWQPLAMYPLIVLMCAVAWSAGHRLRAAGWNLAGVATPFVALMIYYAAEGYLGKFFEGTFIFPLTGVYRPPVSLRQRVHWIFRDIPRAYGNSAIMLWIGLALLLLVAVWTVVSARSQWRAALLGPIVLLLVVSLVTQVAYMLRDYIGWTHSLPLLPYAAVGIGGAVGVVLDRLSWPPPARRVASVALLAAATALTAVSAVAYYQPSNDSALRGERASACAIQRSLAPGTTLWVIDQPVPLVLLHRANPDNYAYVGSGLAEWRVKHVGGGFARWTAQIRASASIVVLDGWRESIPIREQMRTWLSTHGYRMGYIGPWRVYVSSAALVEMRANSILLARRRHLWPITPAGKAIRVHRCTEVTAG